MNRKNSTQPVRLLHLSDIHFRHGTKWDHEPVLRNLTDSIQSEVSDGMTPDLVVITGDLAHGGKEPEYEMARQWLEDELWPVLTASGSETLQKDRLLLIPGNHDVDRDQLNDAAGMIQSGLLKGCDQAKIARVLQDAAQRAPLLDRHQQYIKFYGDWLGEPQEFPWWQRSIEIHGQKLHIAGLDSAWMSSDDNDRGKLLLGRYQLSEMVDARDTEAADCVWH